MPGLLERARSPAIPWTQRQECVLRPVPPDVGRVRGCGVSFYWQASEQLTRTAFRGLSEKEITMSHEYWWHLYPLQVPARDVGSISITEAHIWWTFDEPKDVKIFHFLGSDDRSFAQAKRESHARWSDIGACLCDWKTSKKSLLIQECTEMMLELMVRGVDPVKVVREFSKIREFVMEGSKSYNLARTLSVALQGKALDLREQWNLVD